MIQTFTFKELGKGNYGWLDTTYHFSFANYFNRDRMHLGNLRVINDDYIAPDSRFDPHPHRDMEIITYVVDGELTHEDSMGHKRSIGRHNVQYMSAGTGVVHSEANEGKETLHLYQIWIFPNAKDLTPQYGDKDFSDLLEKDEFTLLVGSTKSDAPIKINQEAEILTGEFTSGNTLKISKDHLDYTYLICIEGQVKVNGKTLSKGDSIEADEDYTLDILVDSHVLLLKVNKR